MGIAELGKLPALLKHYQNHKQLNHGLSFLGFLSMHYANSKHHHQDHQEHDKLPFTDHHSTVCHACIYFMAERNVALSIVFYSIGQTNQSIYQSIAEEDIATHVWQPPRIA